MEFRANFLVKALIGDLLELYVVARVSHNWHGLMLANAFVGCYWLGRNYWMVGTDFGKILWVWQEIGEMLDQKINGGSRVYSRDPYSILVTDFALFASFSSSIVYFAGEKKKMCFYL